MESCSSERFVTFSPETKSSFLNRIHEKPSNRRVSRNDRDNLIEWLTNSGNRPSSQTEFSRRNYVRKTFIWDARSQTLLAKPKSGEEKNRTVIFDDMIADIVELVHEANGHTGWDATWRDISASYYGILRSDVIFLLKQCQICIFDPSKRPKNTRARVTDSPNIRDNPPSDAASDTARQLLDSITN